MVQISVTTSIQDAIHGESHGQICRGTFEEIAGLVECSLASELVMRGILGGETQPFFVGVFGLFVSLLFITSGTALWQKSPKARSLVISTAILSILFHVYAALPPHRNVGLPALIIGAGYGVVLLIITLSSKKRAKASIL